MADSNYTQNNQHTNYFLYTIMNLVGCCISFAYADNFVILSCSTKVSFLLFIAHSTSTYAAHDQPIFPKISLSGACLCLSRFFILNLAVVFTSHFTTKASYYSKTSKINQGFFFHKDNIWKPHSCHAIPIQKLSSSLLICILCY